MNNAQGALLLGVDAGGTKTRVALAELRDGEVMLRATATTGPGNVRSESFQVATANIQEAITQAFAAAKLDCQTLDAACFCVAGAGRAKEQAAVESWALNSKITQRARVVSDADALLAGAAAQLDREVNAGVCVIAGTGSIAVGRNSAGAEARSGGWGYLLGDRGSGFAIGRDALAAIADQADNLGPSTLLTNAILAHLRLQDPQELIGWCYAAPSSRQRIASLAPTVFMCQEDVVASNIVVKASRDLAQHVASVCRKLQLSSPIVACSGSLLVHQPQFLASVFAQLSQLGLVDAIPCLVPNPEQAAVEIARTLIA